MSASEKLRALEAQPNQMAAAWHIAGVIPQLVAVVEEAEAVALMYQYAGILKQGLDALDEALEEGK